MSQITPPVGAVLVTYQPEIATLARVIAAISPQVGGVVVVDNGDGESTERATSVATPALLDSRLQVLRMPSNVGVGAAQNAGIAVLRQQRVRYVLLLDQDSVCAPDMVERLVAAARELEQRGVRVAAVGPRYRAAPGGPLSGFVRFGRWGGRASVSRDGPDGAPVEADFLIASGALVPIAALDSVGPMEEELFIDHVDTEWFLRARHAGLRCFGVPDAEMEHALGEGGSRLWLGRWRHVPDHRPFRYYYIVRNSLLLYRRAYAPLRWIVGDVVRLLGLALLNATVRPGRVLRLRMMARGVRDGVRGIAGPSPLRS